MSRIVDFFGVDVAAGAGVDWRGLVDEQHCPFIERKCYKVRKSSPEVSIGTCTVEYGRSGDPIMICPSRLLERRQIFVDCLHLLRSHLPGNELHTVAEVAIPGGSVDYFLASVRDGRVVDFVGIELQTMDTTGTVWPERQRLLRSIGIDVDDADVLSAKPYGMNWKHTAKTTLIQMHHKIGTFDHLNRHLVLVLQDRLLDYMSGEFAFDHMNEANTGDPMHFHAYRLARGKEGSRLALGTRLSTDVSGIAECLGLQAEANVEMEAATRVIESKLSADTLFNPA